ncbi:MAG: hypothetical protein LBV33_05880 [Lachnospiraceae bacterium]|nr:hypothetical protein [Lachnospiraceae bacterium]
MKNIIYDKAKWHYEASGFPSGLPLENGATHIAFFLHWCIEMGFYSKQMVGDFSEEIMFVKNGQLDSRDLFIKMDGVLCSDDLNTKGNAFATAYYSSGRSKFAKEVGYYPADVDNFAKENLHGEEYFFMENSDENYCKMKSIIDSRYSDFLKMSQRSK